MLGAYYYPWYGKPNSPLLGMGDWQSGFTDLPVLGRYDSCDPVVIKQHIAWAKAAGIDFFITEWLGPGSFADIALKEQYLAAFDSSLFKFCIFYDSSFALNKFRIDSLKTQPNFYFKEEYLIGKNKGEKFLQDFEYLADNYFNQPSYFKIDHKPVVVIYNVSAFQNASDYFKKLRNNMAKRGVSLFLISDVVYWPGLKISKSGLSMLWKESLQELTKIVWRAIWRFNLKKMKKNLSLGEYFSGITGYNLFNINRTADFFKNADKLFQRFSEYAKKQNLIFIPSVLPGYSDRNLKGLSRPILERENGNFYREFWQIARKYLDPKLKMAFIITFNEWHEGTEIEPSEEYGEKYLELTKLFKTDGNHI